MEDAGGDQRRREQARQRQLVDLKEAAKRELGYPDPQRSGGRKAIESGGNGVSDG